MSKTLAIAVRTVVIRDYAVSEEGGVWTAEARESVPPLVLNAASKNAVYVLLVDYVCKHRQDAVRAAVTDLRSVEAP